QVMDGNQQNVLEVGELNQACSEQRSGRDIKRTLCLLNRKSVDFGLPRRVGELANIDHGNPDAHRRGDDLEQFAVFELECGPQNFMAVDNLIERPLQPGNVKLAFEPEPDGYVIRRISWTHSIQFPKSSLRE